MGCRSRRGGFVVSGSGRRWGLKAGVGRRGTMPRFSGDLARPAGENDAEDCLIGGARRQVDLNLLFQFDDAGGDFDEAQPQSVELHDAPSRAFGHQPAHRPEEPVGTGVKEEAKLVGRSLMAGGAVGGEMVLPRLDMVFRLTARAVEPLIERLGATALQVGDNKASVGSLGAGLDPRDNALDPAPAAGSIVELRKAPHLAARPCHFVNQNPYQESDILFIERIRTYLQLWLAPDCVSVEQRIGPVPCKFGKHTRCTLTEPRQP